MKSAIPATRAPVNGTDTPSGIHADPELENGPTQGAPAYYRDTPLDCFFIWKRHPESIAELVFRLRFSILVPFFLWVIPASQTHFSLDQDDVLFDQPMQVAALAVAAAVWFVELLVPVFSGYDVAWPVWIVIGIVYLVTNIIWATQRWVWTPIIATAIMLGAAIKYKIIKFLLIVLWGRRLAGKEERGLLTMEDYYKLGQKRA